MLSCLAVPAWIASSGCAIHSYAVNQLANAVSRSGDAFASDDDPDLVKAASPFSLKLMESLLAEKPRHRGLLLAATSGFTQYAFAFVQEDADETEARDLTAAEALRARAQAAVSAGARLRTARIGSGPPGIYGGVAGPSQGGRAKRHKEGCAAALLDGLRLGGGDFTFERQPGPDRASSRDGGAD